MTPLKIDLQSITSKKEVFWEVLEIYSPEIITGCETWLTSSILDNEVIPRNYKLHQKYRKDGYGGVLIGIKSNLLTKLIDLNTSCEICATSWQVSQILSIPETILGCL